MKINRFLGLGLIAILAVAAMGFISSQVSAQTKGKSALSVQAAPANEDPTSAVDTDQVQEQVGDQNASDTGTDTIDQLNQTNSTDTTQLQGQTGDHNGPDTGTNKGSEVKDNTGGDSQDATPAGLPTITAAAALKAAQSHLKTTATGKVTLDDENGKLIYSVEINGSDIKVDAMNGAILGVDTAGE